MNGEIAQAVALVCHANAALAGRDVGRFLSSNSTCQFCRDVRFVAAKRRFLRRPFEQDVAPAPEAWFEYLKARGASGVLLSRAAANPLKDRLLAGLVGGGGAWLMHVCIPNGACDIWRPRWEVLDKGYDPTRNPRPWLVTWVLVSKSRSRPERPQLPPAALEFEAALEGIRAFSARKGLDCFTKVFDDALDTLRSGGAGLHGYHKDLSPAGWLPAEAVMLLDACQSAWVFGGMGSWNDMGFDGEDGKEYVRVSERLFQVISRTIAAAANASCRGL